MLDNIDKQLITAIQDGLPLTARPYAEIASRIHQTEAQVIQRMHRLQENGTIKRLGVVVKHRALGFKANAMVVWNIPDSQVKSIARRLAAFECITLCYQRPRRLPDWPYNLFTMIHGKDRDSVLQRLEEIVRITQLEQIPHQPLFSTKQFKQRGGRYLNHTTPPNVVELIPKHQQSMVKNNPSETVENDFNELLKPVFG